MAYSKEQKAEALKIQQRCLEIANEKDEALFNQDVEKLAALNLEIDRLSRRMSAIINSPELSNN